MQAIERQAAAAVVEADSIVLVMDGQLGLTAADEEIVSWLRRTHPNKALHLAINKCENPQKADMQVRHHCSFPHKHSTQWSEHLSPPASCTEFIFYPWYRQLCNGFL